MSKFGGMDIEAPEELIAVLDAATSLKDISHHHPQRYCLQPQTSSSRRPFLKSYSRKKPMVLE